MHDSPTLLRRGSSGHPEIDDNDPIVASSIRKRVAALAALAAVAYSVAVPLDLALHAAFATSGLTSPARLKNVAMAILTWWVFLAARRTTFSLRDLTLLAYVMVFLIGLHQTLESLHFFQWQGAEAVATAGTDGSESPSLVDGLPWTCLFMVLFPPFVPGAPKRHLLLALALATPLLGLSAGWAALSNQSFWSIISPEAFANVPISVVLSVFMSIAIHRIDTALRDERRRSRELGSYELVRELGQGGMGEVWLARHKMLARPAALKLIKSDRIQGPTDRVADVLRRFEREARATALLRSTHTVELYDFGRTDAGDFYYVMELLDGMDLEALVEQEGPQPPWRVARILRQVCLSLAEAHAQGMIHRDIKPANIFLCRQGEELDVVKVLDFGLVTGVARGEPEGQDVVTRDNELLGTPAFMAPEMVTAPDEVDQRADLYAVGCVGYWLLTGHQLFEEKTVVALLFAHVHTQIPSPLFPDQDVPPQLEAVLARTLAKDPTERPQSARELMNILEAAEAGGKWSEDELQNWWDKVRPPAEDRNEARGRS